MNDYILMELMQEYEALRAANTREEAARFEKAAAACPDIARLHEARQEMVFGALRRAIAHEDVASEADSMVRRMEDYNARLRTLLVAAGFPEDYLQPIYRCPICKDTGYIETPLRKRCTCLKAAYAKRTMAERGAGPAAMMSFADYNEYAIPDTPLEYVPMTQRAYTNMLRDKALTYAMDFPSTATPNLLFVGQSGLGKTFLLQSIGKEVLDSGFHVEYVGAYKLIEQARKAYFTNVPEEMNAYYQCDLLLIDDLGTEPLMENITIPSLFQIIDQRLQKGAHTIISTNFNAKEIKERYTERIASRLFDTRRWEILAFYGRDIRLVPPESQ